MESVGRFDIKQSAAQNITNPNEALNQKMEQAGVKLAMPNNVVNGGAGISKADLQKEADTIKNGIEVACWIANSRVLEKVDQIIVEPRYTGFNRESGDAIRPLKSILVRLNDHSGQLTKDKALQRSIENALSTQLNENIVYGTATTLTDGMFCIHLDINVLPVVDPALFEVKRDYISVNELPDANSAPSEVAEGQTGMPKGGIWI